MYRPGGFLAEPRVIDGVLDGHRDPFGDGLYAGVFRRDRVQAVANGQIGQFGGGEFLCPSDGGVLLAGFPVAGFGYEDVDGGSYGTNGVPDEAAAWAGVGFVLAPALFLVTVNT